MFNMKGLSCNHLRRMAIFTAKAGQQFQIQKFIAPKAQTCLSFAGISCNLIAENPQLRRFLCLANSNNAPI